jgi:ArsR family transcriptional regulator, virulence genes transcriptional regulator
MPSSANIKLIHSGLPAEIKLDYTLLRKSVLLLRSINHPHRHHIIQMLEENEMLTVTEVYIKLRLEQSVASQHLAILRKSGILTTQRNGKFVYYRLNRARLAEIGVMISELYAVQNL